MPQLDVIQNTIMLDWFAVLVMVMVVFMLKVNSRKQFSNLKVRTFNRIIKEIQ